MPQGRKESNPLKLGLYLFVTESKFGLGHFCLTLHVTMQNGLYLHPLVSGVSRISLYGLSAKAGCLGVFSFETFTDTARFLIYLLLSSAPT